MAGGSALPISSWAGGAAQTTLGGIEAYYAYKGLQNLEGQPMPGYTMSPEFQDYYNQSKQRSSYGFDPSEKAAFNQNVAQQQNTGFQQGVQQSGGNLAQALSAGFGAQNLQSQNQFAGQNAQLHRQNFQDFGQAAGQMQSQENLINQDKIRRRIQLEQAYGGALQTGLGNISNGLNSGAGATNGTTWGSSQQAPQPPQLSGSQMGYGMGARPQYSLDPSQGQSPYSVQSPYGGLGTSAGANGSMYGLSGGF